MVKRPYTMRETWFRVLGWEDPLEKEMAIHSSTVAWKIPRTEEPGRLQSMGLERVGYNFTFTSCGLSHLTGKVSKSNELIGSKSDKSVVALLITC